MKNNVSRKAWRRLDELMRGYAVMSLFHGPHALITRNYYTAMCDAKVAYKLALGQSVD